MNTEHTPTYRVVSDTGISKSCCNAIKTTHMFVIRVFIPRVSPYSVR